jgi:hypothetical protein
MKTVTITENRQDRAGRTLQVPVAATVASSFTPKVLSEVGSWTKLLSSYGAEDSGWDWTLHLKESRWNQRHGVGRYEYFVLRCRGEVQALSILETLHHASPITHHSIVYVEYIAVAPWNRLEVQDPRRFSGCGRALLMVAVERSVALGCGGVIGLHALPRSHGFYRSIGMKDLGADPGEHGLHYFELRA